MTTEKLLAEIADLKQRLEDAKEHEQALKEQVRATLDASRQLSARLEYLQRLSIGVQPRRDPQPPGRKTD